MPGYSKCSLSFKFPRHTLSVFLFYLMRAACQPPHPPSFYPIAVRVVKKRKLLITQLTSSFWSFSPFRIKDSSFWIPCSRTPSAHTIVPAWQVKLHIHIQVCAA
jgi:hypothetical protein